MSIPTFSISPVSSHDPSVLPIVGLVESDGNLTVWADEGFEALTEVARTLRASTSVESFTRVLSPLETPHVIGLLGLGKSSPTLESLRSAAGALTRKLEDQQAVEFRLPLRSESEVLAILEGALLGGYSFETYKSNSKKPKQSLEHINIVSDVEISAAALAKVEQKVRSVALVKDLVNTPASDLNPDDLAQEAKAIAEGLGLDVRIWNEKDLKTDGLGGILGVGQGSDNPPRLVKIDYKPATSTRHVSLVGKGITFDTGGLSLKSTAGMVGMKYDMTGAATVLAVIQAAARLKIDLRVTAWLCLAENMPSANATKPNDVLRIRNGKTVEVLNTDAEGRLVLADGLSMASEEHPDLIIDVATLTGAARGALGTRTVGAMGDAAAVSRLVEVASTSGESVWHMPLPSELRALLNSDIADLINGRPGNTTAGMLLAGVFLSEFVGKKENSSADESIPWIHLDIAGTADNSGSAFGFTAPGPTGVTVRALIDFLDAGA